MILLRLLFEQLVEVLTDTCEMNEPTTVKRSEFKAMMVPLIQEQFNVCLRNDLKIDERQGVRGWKNMRMIQTATV